MDEQWKQSNNNIIQISVYNRSYSCKDCVNNIGFRYVISDNNVYRYFQDGCRINRYITEISIGIKACTEYHNKDEKKLVHDILEKDISLYDEVKNICTKNKNIKNVLVIGCEIGRIPFDLCDISKIIIAIDNNSEFIRCCNLLKVL